MASTPLFCDQCATTYPAGSDYPLTCLACGHVRWRNPLPVAVCLVPVGTEGLLVVYRDIAPQGWALPGGFIEWGEDWRHAAARELHEETGLMVSPNLMCMQNAYSAPDGTLLLAAVTQPLETDYLDMFVANDEVRSLSVLPRQPTDDNLLVADDLVFDLHQQMVIDFLR